MITRSLIQKIVKNIKAKLFLLNYFISYVYFYVNPPDLQESDEGANT